MPYARKYKRTTMGRKFFRRRAAASTLQRAWRNRQRRRRGGLVARTALANRKSIKRINRKIETKYATKHVCSATNNYTGQLLVASGVDCMGMPNQLSGLVGNNPNIAGTPNATWSSNSLVMRPICLPLGDDEGQRVGEYINMTWLNIKGFVSAWPASCNGTNPSTNVNFGDRPQRQRVRIVVVLDTQPVPWTSNAAPPSIPATYQPDQCPGYLYDLDLPITNYPALPVTLYSKNREFLRGLAKAPLGATGADSSVDPWSQSYYENDYVCSAAEKTKRFKILKTLTLEIAQPTADYAVSDVPSRRNFSMTIKAPFRFQFSNSKATTPKNQEILIFFASDTRVKSPSLNTDTTPIVCTPKVVCQCKLAFKDP